MAETITVTLPGAATGTYDTQGNPVRAASTSSSLEIRGFAPNVSDETENDAGQLVVSGATVWADRGTVIPPNAILTIRGQTWQMSGEVGDFLSPYPNAHPNARGVQFAVKRAT